MDVVFYELPPGSFARGVACLVSVLVERGPLAVVVATRQQAQEVSDAMWAMPPSLLVPHGLVGEDAEEVDPAIISVGPPPWPRPVVVCAAASGGPMEASDLVAEVVPHEPELREASRARFKEYRVHGFNPRFVPWESWWSREGCSA